MESTGVGCWSLSDLDLGGCRSACHRWTTALVDDEWRKLEVPRYWTHVRNQRKWVSLSLTPGWLWDVMRKRHEDVRRRKFPNTIFEGSLQKALYTVIATPHVWNTTENNGENSRSVCSLFLTMICCFSLPS